MHTHIHICKHIYEINFTYTHIYKRSTRRATTLAVRVLAAPSSKIRTFVRGALPHVRYKEVVLFHGFLLWTLLKMYVYFYMIHTFCANPPDAHISHVLHTHLTHVIHSPDMNFAHTIHTHVTYSSTHANLEITHTPNTYYTHTPDTYYTHTWHILYTCNTHTRGIFLLHTHLTHNTHTLHILHTRNTHTRGKFLPTPI